MKPQFFIKKPKTEELSEFKVPDPWDEMGKNPDNSEITDFGFQKLLEVYLLVSICMLSASMHSASTSAIEFEVVVQLMEVDNGH